jgi:Xaa-Pro aminopeptidase
MTTYSAYVIREMSDFIWDGFCDPAAVGVNIFDILDGASLVGVKLTPAQRDSVISHSNDFGEWTSDDEEVRDAIAAATDCVDYEKMYAWLSFIVGDTTAAGLVKNWEEEAQTILDRFDRVNEAHTMTVKSWKDTFSEELKETKDEDERDAIKAAASLLDGLEDSALAICYVATDPVDFVVLPYGATTQAEQKLCRELALN